MQSKLPAKSGGPSLKGGVACGLAFPKTEKRPYEVREIILAVVCSPIQLDPLRGASLTRHRLPGTSRGRDPSARAQKLLVCEREVSLSCTPNPTYTLPHFTASIGNFLLAGSQSFFRSLPSAIFLFSSITNSNVRGVVSSPSRPP